MITVGSQHRTILVTGGNGRLGRLVVDDLRSYGARVVSLARSRSDEGHQDDVQVDLRDAAATRRAIFDADADAMVHLASVLRGADLALENEQIDKAVASAAADGGIRHIVVASSGSVYGTGAAQARTERSPVIGDTTYALSKQKTEMIFESLASRFSDMSLTTLRIFNLSGPRFPDSLVQRLIRAQPADPVRVTGADSFVRDYIHQSDLLSILRKAIWQRETGVRVINVGAGVPVSSRDLITRIRPDPDSYVETAGEATSSWTDVSEMIRVFGVVPRSMPDRSWDCANLS